MVLVLHSNAKHLVLPPPKSCLSWQKPPRRQDHSDFRWYSDLFILHGVNLTVETNKQAREMYFDKPLYGYFYILLLPLDGKSSDQQVKRRKHPKAGMCVFKPLILTPLVNKNSIWVVVFQPLGSFKCF